MIIYRQLHDLTSASTGHLKFLRTLLPALIMNTFEPGKEEGKTIASFPHSPSGGKLRIGYGFGVLKWTALSLASQMFLEIYGMLKIQLTNRKEKFVKGFFISV